MPEQGVWAHANRLVLVFLLSCLAWWPLHGQAQQVAVPVWTAAAMDTSGTLSADELAALNQRLQAFEQASGVQIFVLLIDSTGDESIEQYARRVFDDWEIGRKGVDDGVLLLVARQDRKLRIEVGYGLEGAIPDVAAGRIVREQISPAFAQAEFAAGINRGVQSLMLLIQGEELPPPEADTPEEDMGRDTLFFFPMLFLALIVHPVIASFMLGMSAVALFDSWLLGLGAAVLGLVLSLIGHALGLPKRFQRKGGGSSGTGGTGRRGGGGFGGGRGGGGRSGGGGGRGGGGGASGGW